MWRDVYAKYLSRPEVTAWLAVTAVGGAPVGYAMLTPPELPVETMEAGDVELKRIYALSRFHGSGVAQRMMPRPRWTRRERAALGG